MSVTTPPTTHAEPSTSTSNLCRCIIVDETSDKCVIFNVESGKQLTVLKKRLRSIDSVSMCQTTRHKHLSCALIKLLPFMVIKAKPDKELKDEALQRTLLKSCYYLDRIELNICGTWSSRLNNFASVESSNALNNLGQAVKANYAKFFQSEKDLFKVVELKAQESEQVDKLKGSRLISTLTGFKTNFTQSYYWLVSYHYHKMCTS